MVMVLNVFLFLFGVFNTKIVLEGILYFKYNSAYIGSVFNVIGSSWFILQLNSLFPMTQAGLMRAGCFVNIHYNFSLLQYKFVYNA